MRRTFAMVTEPNVVPMIDVLLVLLIIFMLVVVVPDRRAFDLVLPEPAGASTGAQSIVLTVANGPRYSLNGRDLPPDNLEGGLRDAFRDRRERILFVEGDRALSYQSVIRAFDAARGAGITVTAIVPGAKAPHIRRR
jgi:biopolymer transport protein ExbD